MTAIPEQASNRRILIVDDNPAIHDDFRKVLVATKEASALDAIEASLFDEAPAPATDPGFELTSAFQGQEALDKVRAAIAEQQPFSVVFLDIRMPPGWDGVETALRLWEVDPRLQIVICSAYSDYSWEQMRSKLGARQHLLILKKPFDPIEVLQLAHALTEKWALLLASRRTLTELESAVASRTQDLASTNQKLVQEIGRREEIEARLRHSQKLEALGRLAGGIAHEINNPLAFIVSNLSFISEVVEELQAPVPISSDLNQATRDAMVGAERIRRIVRDVKIFSQAEAAPLAQVDLDRVLHRAVDMAAPELAEAGAGDVAVDLGGVAEVMGSEEGLVQVFYNLVVNAAHAHRGATPPNAISITTHLDPQGRAAIEVRDRGAGIRADNLARIFDPFFTTKDVGSGTGLGLCICHGIVTKLGGEITAESQLGSGSMFRVTLSRPAASAPVPAAA